jgi:hypothetical protein
MDNAVEKCSGHLCIAKYVAHKTCHIDNKKFSVCNFFRQKIDWMPLLRFITALFILVQKIAVFKHKMPLFSMSKNGKKALFVRICRFWLTEANLVNFERKRHIHDCRFCRN